MDAKQNISSIRHFLTMRHTDCDAFAEMGLLISQEKIIFSMVLHRASP